MKYRVIIRRSGAVHVTEMEGKGYAHVCKQVAQVYGLSATIVDVQLIGSS